jgi:hypothetical protein
LTRITLLFSLSLVWLAFSRVGTPIPSSTFSSPYKKIVCFAKSVDSSQDRDSEVFGLAAQVIDQIDNPTVLGQLVIAFRNHNHRSEHDGRCAVCERLRDAAEHCLTRLADLGSDAAGRELIRLWTDDNLLWDGGSSLWMGNCITRMGKVAVPHLNEIIKDRRKSPKFGEKAGTYIDCIRRGEIYGP